MLDYPNHKNLTKGLLALGYSLLPLTGTVNRAYLGD